MDAGFSLNSFCSGRMNLSEVLNPFTASTMAFNGKDDDIPINPQTPQTKGMLSHHPVEVRPGFQGFSTGLAMWSVDPSLDSAGPCAWRRAYGTLSIRLYRARQ